MTIWLTEFDISAERPILQQKVDGRWFIQTRLNTPPEHGRDVACYVSTILKAPGLYRIGMLVPIVIA
ncbi:MAG: hypothetical protein RIE73_25955 [Coleofasciculus sp. C1-SOL-03]|uniref:hypothetical protein n=1 Tax=Coleofasciculus sp. C1-SOL-03 TaxID=3069522 RepID=UPI0032F77E6E